MYNLLDVSSIFPSIYVNLIYGLKTVMLRTHLTRHSGCSKRPKYCDRFKGMTHFEKFFRFDHQKSRKKFWRYFGHFDFRTTIGLFGHEKHRFEQPYSAGHFVPDSWVLPAMKTMGCYLLHRSKINFLCKLSF